MPVLLQTITYEVQTPAILLISSYVRLRARMLVRARAMRACCDAAVWSTSLRRACCTFFQTVLNTRKYHRFGRASEKSPGKGRPLQRAVQLIGEHVEPKPRHVRAELSTRQDRHDRVVLEHMIHVFGRVPFPRFQQMSIIRPSPFPFVTIAKYFTAWPSASSISTHDPTHHTRWTTTSHSRATEVLYKSQESNCRYRIPAMAVWKASGT